MPITVTCSCGKSWQVGDEFAGRDGACPGCGQAIHIPGAAEGQITGQPPRPAPRPPPPWDRPDYDAEPDDDSAILRTHDGRPIAADDDFFVDAPPALGLIQSVYTSLKKHKAPMPFVLKAVLSIILFVLAAAVSAFMTGWLTFAFRIWLDWPIPFPAILIVTSILAGIISLSIFSWWTRFVHTCSYVGRDGIAVFQCAGARERVIRKDIFHFKDAIELRTGQTRQYYLGGYAGTDYVFLWFDERGNIAYRFMGRYKSETGIPAPDDPYHFMLMAEHAWTTHLLRDIDRILADDEVLYFPLKEGDFVRLGEGLLILEQAGRRIELRADQIEKITMGDGVISVWEAGARKGWFVSEGVYQFMYHDLGNARFFTMALEKLLGFQL